jgi:hypothetical protein
MRRLTIWLAAAVLVMGIAATAMAGSGHFETHLTGDEEVPAIVTGGQGQATFKLSADGQSVSYKLNVANLEDIIQAHIHIGAPGVNGSVVVFLFGPVAGGVDVSGRLAEGSFGTGDLINVPAGFALSDLIAAIEAGNAYVNVHTVAHTGGEIRGQL